MEPSNQLNQSSPSIPPNNSRKRTLLVVGIITGIVLLSVLIILILSKRAILKSNLPEITLNNGSVNGSFTWEQFGFDPQNTGQIPFTGPQTNKVKWIYKLGSTSCGFQTQATPVVLDGSGNLYFGTSEGSLISLDPQMRKRWEYKLPDAYPRTNCKDGYEPGALSDRNIDYSPVLSNGQIIFGTSGQKNAKKIYSLDLNGKLVWSYGIDGVLESHIKLGSNNRIYFTTATTLYALTDKGTDVKTYPVVGKLNVPAIGSDGSVYVCSAEGLLALASDLKLKWVFNQTQNLRTCMSAVDPKTNVIYFPYKNTGKNIYKLYALNSDGSLKWNTDIYWSESAPAIGND